MSHHNLNPVDPEPRPIDPIEPHVPSPENEPVDPPTVPPGKH